MGSRSKRAVYTHFSCGESGALASIGVVSGSWAIAADAVVDAEPRRDRASSVAATGVVALSSSMAGCAS